MFWWWGGGRKEPLVLWWSQFKDVNSKFKTEMRHLKPPFTKNSFLQEDIFLLRRHIDAHIYTLFILGCIKKESIHQVWRGDLGLSFQKCQSAPYHHVSLARSSLCLLLPDHWLRALFVLWHLGVLFENLLAKVGTTMLTGNRSSSRFLR